jgi:hypothetical protein
VKIIFAISKEAKTKWSNSRQIWQNLVRRAVADKGRFANDVHDMLKPTT